MVQGNVQCVVEIRKKLVLIVMVEERKCMAMVVMLNIVPARYVEVQDTLYVQVVKVQETVRFVMVQEELDK